jgi:DNA gyrase/topoisomerase IV subunit A
VFRSRSSEGVRGIDLASGDAVISMSILDHMTLTIEERDGITGRNAQGVIIFDVGQDERVVSVARVLGENGDNGENGEDDA